MTNANKALDADYGFLVNNGPFFTGGASSPVGLDLPVGTIYGQTASTGLKLWRKYNTGVNDWIVSQPMDFYQKVSATAETSTTSTTTFSNKLTLTTPALPSGNYRINWMFKWRAANASRFLDLRVQRAAANIFTAIPFYANVTSRLFESGFLPVDSLSGAQTFTLDFKVTGSGTTVYMSDAYMEFWRIS